MTADLSPMDTRPGSGLTCRPCLHTVTQPGGLHPTLVEWFRARHREATCDVQECGNG